MLRNHRTLYTYVTLHTSRMPVPHSTGDSFPLITQLEKTQQIMYTESIAFLYNLLASLVFGAELGLTKPRE